MKTRIKVRNAKMADIPALLAIDEEIWPQFRATPEMFQSRVETFPEGQFVAMLNGQVVGSVFTQLIDYKDWGDKTFTWNNVTDFGTIRRTHNPKGDSIYGVGLAVTKRFQGSATSKLLVMASVCMTIRMNLCQILLGSRIPAYHRHSEIPVEEYIHATREKNNRFLDPELAFYQKYNGEPIKPLPNYMDDPESLNFGVLIRWKNPFYNKPLRWIIPFVLKIFPNIF